MQNVYEAIGWDILPGILMTDTPSNTAVRAPGKICKKLARNYGGKAMKVTLNGTDI